MTNYAVLVGVSNYYDEPMITNLPHSAGAIKKLKDVLINHGDFNPDNIKIFIEQNKNQNSLTLPLKYSVISSLLKLSIEWNNIQKDDSFLFYFIGHGYGSNDKGDQLLMMDTCFQFIKETALSATILTQLIRRIPARQKLIVFDCCRNEVKGAQSIQEGLGKDKIKEFLTLYACQPGELAWIPKQGKLPLLTHEFIETVKDENCLSFREMINKVIDGVYKSALKLNVIQTPLFSFEGEDLENIGFLSRKLRVKPTSLSGDYVNTIQDIYRKLCYLYEKKYPHHAPSYNPFMNAAKGLNEWEQKLNKNTFRRLAYEFLERGENADVYVLSYMLRWGPDHNLFEPLVDCLSSKKYRGTAVWQALDALEVMLREDRMVEKVSADEHLKNNMATVLKKIGTDHPTHSTYGGLPFGPSVVWGKMLQICKRLNFPIKDIFTEEALKKLQ